MAKQREHVWSLKQLEYRILKTMNKIQNQHLKLFTL